MIAAASHAATRFGAAGKARLESSVHHWLDLVVTSDNILYDGWPVKELPEADSDTLFANLDDATGCAGRRCPAGLRCRGIVASYGALGG